MKPLLILLLVAAGGCVTRVDTVRTAQPAPAPQRQTVTDKRVVIDPALEHVIRIVGIKSSAEAGGFLKIQLDVQNLTDSPAHFSYFIEWFDREGAALPLAASSMPWMLLRHETSSLATTAPTPAAKDFRITFAGPGAN